MINAPVEYDNQRRLKGIRDPYLEGFWNIVNEKLKTRAVFKKGTGNHWPIRTNRIKVVSKTNDSDRNKTTDELYYTFSESLMEDSETYDTKEYQANIIVHYFL